MTEFSAEMSADFNKPKFVKLKTETRQLIRAAEERFDAASSLKRQGKKSFAKVISFHCQDCIEKYLKAYLEEVGLLFPKRRNLSALFRVILSRQPLWAVLKPQFALLNNYTLKIVYPGRFPFPIDAEAALEACLSIRAEIRLSLGLSKK